MRTDPPSPVVVMPGRSRLLLLVAVSAASLLLGLWFVGVLGSPPRGRFPRWLPLAIGYLLVAFFGSTLLFGLARVASRSPLLVIDVEGMDERATTMASVGRLRWEEITGTAVSTVGRQRFLKIELRDADEVIARSPPRRRWLLEASRKLTGSPVNIPASALPMRIEDLQATIESFRRAHAAARAGSAFRR